MPAKELSAACSYAVLKKIRGEFFITNLKTLFKSKDTNIVSNNNKN